MRQERTKADTMNLSGLRWVEHETERIFAERLKITAIASIPIVLLYSIVDYSLEYHRVPHVLFAKVISIRLILALVLFLTIFLIERYRDNSLLLSCLDIWLFGVMGVALTYITAIMWYYTPDYWLAVCQLIIGRCVIFPTGPRRAFLSCVSLLLVLPVSLVWFSPSRLTTTYGDGPSRLLAAQSTMIGFLVIGLIASHIYNKTLTESLKFKQMNRYRLDELLGEGGFGSVYRAWDNSLDRPCAIKIIHSSLLQSRRDLRERFILEAQKTSLLQSNHIVSIYDFGETISRELYYVMEYLEGMDLKRLVERCGPLPPSRVIQIGRQVCIGLSQAHQKNMIHRDIKPANIFLQRLADKSDNIKILDFGLIKVLNPDEVPEHNSKTATAVVNQIASDADNTPEISLPSGFLGTPTNLAPEQIVGSIVGPHTDIYALGAVLYYLLTGAQCFPTESIIEIITAKMSYMPQAPSLRFPELQIPKDLENIVMKCLEILTTNRYQSTIELLHDLERCDDAFKWSREQSAQFWENMEQK